MGTKLKWGIAGLGKIANTFAEDLLRVEGAELVAVASSNKERAKTFATKFNVNTNYGSYDALFKDWAVDVVYIAGYHTQHVEMSIAAMNHGKHVLCEKPLAINYADAKRMINASLKNKVFFMEGLWSRFNPSIKKTIRLINDGEIGELRHINAEFAFYGLDRDDDSRLLNTALGGGSLLDIGIYPIFLAYVLLGKPKNIFATSQFYRTGAEIQTSMIFAYDSAQAMLYSSFADTSSLDAKISGEEGEIYIDYRWHEAEGLTLVKNAEKTRYDLPIIGNGFTNEIEEVHQCLSNGQIESSYWSHQNSLDLIQLIDEVRQITGARFPLEE